MFRLVDISTLVLTFDKTSVVNYLSKSIQILFSVLNNFYFEVFDILNSILNTYFFFILLILNLFLFIIVIILVK